MCQQDAEVNSKLCDILRGQIAQKENEIAVCSCKDERAILTRMKENYEKQLETELKRLKDAQSK